MSEKIKEETLNLQHFEAVHLHMDKEISLLENQNLMTTSSPQRLQDKYRKLINQLNRLTDNLSGKQTS